MENLFAASAACWASSKRPSFHSLSTEVALIIATIPNGTQHKQVHKIVQIKFVSEQHFCSFITLTFY